MKTITQNQMFYAYTNEGINRGTSNTSISAVTRAAGVGAVSVTVLGWVCAEATANEAYQ